MSATRKKLSHEALVSYLRTVSFFADLDHGIIKELAHKIGRRVLDPGQILLEQGDSSESMFVVYSGNFEVFIKQSNEKISTVGTIGPGETAGEIQILTGGKRTATVCAKEKSEVLELTRDTFQSLMDANPGMMNTLTDTVRSRIRRNILIALIPDLFGVCTDSIVLDIEECSSWIHLRKGEVLFRENDTGRDLYIMICGRLGVSRTRSTGTEQLVGEISRGEIVGEMAVFTGEPRSATIYAKRDSQLLRFSKESFQLFAEKYPQILFHLTKNIIQRLKMASTGKRRRDDIEKVAVITLGRDIPITEFTTRLQSAVGPSEVVLSLNSTVVDNELETPGISQLPDDDPNSMRLIAWLDDREFNHRYVLYETDWIGSGWMRRCIDRADRILVVVDSTSNEHSEMVEEFKNYVSDNTAVQDIILVALHSGRETEPHRIGFLFDFLNVRDQFHIDWSSSYDFERLGRYLTGRSIGLVLGGGGARGYAHIGVIRALQDAGVLIDAVGGTSMGAIIAAHVALGTAPEEIVRLHKDLHSKHRPYREYTLPVFSLLGGRRLDRVMKRYMNNVQIEDLWLPFFCVSTDISTAGRVVHRRGSLWKAVRASLSIPGIFPPVIENEHLLVDGCLMNNLPGDIMHDLYGGTVIVVNVTPKEDLVIPGVIQEIPSPMKFMWNRMRQGDETVDIPTILTIMIRSSMIGSAKKVREIVREADYYIDPPVSKFGLSDYNAIDEIVDVGYKHAQRKIDEWRNEERFKEILA